MYQLHTNLFKTHAPNIRNYELTVYEVFNRMLQKFKMQIAQKCN